jgi:hypothetical protein
VLKSTTAVRVWHNNDKGAEAGKQRARRRIGAWPHQGALQGDKDRRCTWAAHVALSGRWHGRTGQQHGRLRPGAHVRH